jgi:hypothetical protein
MSLPPRDPERARAGQPPEPGDAWRRHTRIHDLIETIRADRRRRATAPVAAEPAREGK